MAQAGSLHLSSGTWIYVGLILSLVFVLCILRALRQSHQELARRRAALLEQEHRVRRSESFLASIIENVPHGVFVKEAAEFRYILANAAIAEATGISNEEMLGKRDVDLFPAEVAAYFNAKDAETFESGSLVSIEEEEVPGRDGSHRTMRVQKVPIFDEAGRPCFIVGISEDISESKAAQAALQAAKDVAERATQAKSDFLATMSHEIRTPLNGVLGMTGLLLNSRLDAEQREFAEIARTSGDALLAVINDILDFSKIEAGKLELEVVDFDLAASVQEALEIVALTAHAKDIEVGALADPRLPRAVRGDPGRFRQVLCNLLSNAVKFTDDGQVVVRTELLHESEDHVEVRVEVVDSGVGIEVETQALLFESFAQADASTTRRYGGTGLGLAISRRLVELQHGEIGVVSAPDEGSTFWFTVRFDRSRSPMNDSAEPAPTLDGLRVLVVDDNETNRLILERMLCSWKMKPTCVSDGAGALSALRDAHGTKDQFAVALLDCFMPGMSGHELARAVRADARLADTRLVLLASSGRRGDAGAARLAGIDDFVTKPVRPSSMFDCLARLVDGAPGSAVGAADDARPADRSDGGRGRPHLLVVEDNVVNQKVAKRTLENLGCRVDVAANGTEAVAATARVPYAAVLMDCQMPEMDGYAATAAIRAREGGERRTAIIAMTAGAGSADKAKCLAAGMDDFLTKPVNAAALSRTLRRWVWDAQNRATHVEPPPPLDLRFLAPIHEFASDDPEGIRDLLRLFVTESRGRLDAAAAAAARGDLAGVAPIAHSLRGSSGTFAAHLVAALCSDLERSSLENDGDGVQALLARLDVEFERAVAALGHELGLGAEC